jgi:hypothetical protein
MLAAWDPHARPLPRWSGRERQSPKREHVIAGREHVIGLREHFIG